VLSDLNEQSINQWQIEWERSSKGAITKSFFSKITDRLKLKINVTPNSTAIVTGHGHIKTYLAKYRIIGSNVFLQRRRSNIVDHFIYDCKLLEQDRSSLKGVVIKTEKWLVSRDKLSTKCCRYFKEFMDNIKLDKVWYRIKT
jgi:hypothetical protein